MGRLVRQPARGCTTERQLQPLRRGWETRGAPKASYNDGTVTWVDGESDPQTIALLMVHEAAHEVGPSHVPCLQDPDVQCDASWKGAYGKELAAASWGAEVADNEQRRALYPELRDTYRRHINAD